MTTYAIIENGKVINTIIADQDFIDAAFPGAVELLEGTSTAGIDWDYNSETNTFTDNRPKPEPVIPPVE